MRAQIIGAGLIDAQFAHDPSGHPHLDLVEEAHVRRVERVVEVKDPCVDMGKAVLDHGGEVAWLCRRGKGGAGCGFGLPRDRGGL